MSTKKFSSASECPLEHAMAMIGGKWKPILLYHLSTETLRFSQLRRKIPQATDQMLTRHLREMEADGLVSRTVFAQVPPRVEYALTPSAVRLLPLLDQVVKWAVEHKKEMVVGIGFEPTTPSV